ncbi:MAG: hypothetical protein SOZ52_07890 [Pyramidobacter sp.]|nr:hypothetical protein [Pyramidobacter sp.]
MTAHVQEGFRVSSVTADYSFARAVILSVPDASRAQSRIFSLLAQRDIAVELIAQNSMDGTADIVFLVKKDRLEETIAVCRSAAELCGAMGTAFVPETALICVSGDGMTESSCLAAAFFEALSQANVSAAVTAFGARGVSCAVAAHCAETVCAALKKRFCLN